MPANKTPSDGQRPAAQRTSAQRAAAAERIAARAGATSTPAAQAPSEAPSATTAPPKPVAKATPAKTVPAKTVPAKTASATAALAKSALAKSAPAKSVSTTAKAPEAESAQPAATKIGATKTAATKALPAKSGPAKSSGRPATKSAGRPAGNRASAARAARTAAAGPSKKRPKSLVVRRRTPWGLIITCVLVVVFAAAVIGYAVSRPKKVSADDAPYVRNEIAAAKAIPGMLFKKHIQHLHITTLQKYDTSPPTGGDHSAVWADCTGTVYPKQIANENAVHPLEHGAVWITYRPGLDATSVATLAKLVTGVNYTLMTPYAGLKTPISLQAWNYQLFVNSATDPRIAAFLKALRNNPGTTPEYPGNCVDAAFKASPSTPGHPTF